MSLFARFNLAETPEATVVEKFYQAQIDVDFSNASEFFAEDIVFNGLMFHMKGIDETRSVYVEFLSKFSAEIKIEGVSMPDKQKRCMVLHSLAPLGEKTVFVCDLLHFRDGKISLIENCFDVDSIPKEIHDDAEQKKQSKS